MTLITPLTWISQRSHSPASRSCGSSVLAGEVALQLQSQKTISNRTSTATEREWCENGSDLFRSVMLEEGVRLYPCTSLFPLQFGKCQPLQKVHVFLYFCLKQNCFLTAVPLFSASFLYEEPIKPRKVRFSQAHSARSAHGAPGSELPTRGCLKY